MRSHAVTRRLATGLIAVVLLAAGFWAGRVTLAPRPLPDEIPASEVTAQVTHQSVGRQLTLNVTVEQEKRPLATNALAGVVTHVRTDGEDARQGDVLYRVANVPVRAVEGSVPFYRPLAAGASGADVRQLQNALVSMRLLASGNGTFGDSTTRAVRAWQKRLGMPESGTVELGELVAAPALPARLMLDSAVIAPGRVLAGGEMAVLGAVGEPSFVLPLSEQQTRIVPESATVVIPHQGREWPAAVAASVPGTNGEILYRLSAPGGGPVCGSECALFASDDKLSLLAKVAVVPPVSGPAVPVAAVTTRADGAAVVTVLDAAGAASERTVTVLGSQDGVAVVEGVEPGETVRVLAAGR